MGTRVEVVDPEGCGQYDSALEANTQHMNYSNGTGAEKRILLTGDKSAIEEIQKLISTQRNCTAEIQPDGARAASMVLELPFDAVLVCCRHPHQEFLRLLGTLFSNDGVTVTTPSPEESVPAAGA